MEKRRAVIAVPAAKRHRAAMNASAQDAILQTVTRLPDWIRHDLAAKDPALRTRAEEALAAMLADGLKRAAPG